mmetsp:Transcript_12293/g.49524  ORF Transcript_12293/g.49524 Transcript_12293/m.49524 type:complete len:759 (-) Transcript_12293:119-2395(-)
MPGRPSTAWPAGLVAAAVGVVVAVGLAVRRRRDRRVNDDVTVQKRVLELLEGRWTTVSGPDATHPRIRFLTFNVLADAYARGQSRHCAAADLTWRARRDALVDVIRRADADVVCLQEADHHATWWTPQLEALGYAVAIAPREQQAARDDDGDLPRSSHHDARRRPRTDLDDACVTAWRASRFSAVQSPRIERFDDLVADESDPLAKRYRRHNVGLVCVLRLTEDDDDDTGERQIFAVANAHLHWDPTREDVKLAQTRALLRACPAGLPVVIGGDLNSRPASPPLRLVFDGSASVDCRRLAFNDTDTTSGDNAVSAAAVDREAPSAPPLSPPPPPGAAAAAATTTTTEDTGSSASSTAVATKGGPPRIAVDFNLNRLCRWLRLCGIDAIIETADEAAARCAPQGGGPSRSASGASATAAKASSSHASGVVSSSSSKSLAFVARAVRERRLLVTSSKALVARREVASIPHVFVPSTATTEAAFRDVVAAAGAQLGEADALTRCVLCNGSIADVAADRAAALRAKDLKGPGPPKLPHDPSVALYECTGCGQVFWWSERANSSAARAKDLADKLRRLVAAAATSSSSRAEGSALNLGVGAHTSSDGAAKIGAADGPTTTTTTTPRTSASPPTSSAALLAELTAGVTHDLGPLRSAMPVAGEGPFFHSVTGGVVTNFVPGFAAQIDYLLYTAHDWTLLRRRDLPTTGALRRALGRRAFLPCREWPSDHIPVVAELALRNRPRRRPVAELGPREESGVGSERYR